MPPFVRFSFIVAQAGMKKKRLNKARTKEKISPECKHSGETR